MKSWRDSFVGSTLRGNFESSISGGKLREPTNKAQVVSSVSMHATIVADPAFTTGTLPDNLRNMLPLTGTDVAFIGTVKVESSR